MATAKQIASNRRNAQRSTGPTSPAGKQTVSQNRLRHGLCGRFQVLEGVEKQEQYDALLNQLMEDEQPVGQAEIELVVKMAEHTWLSKRALRMQSYCFIPQPKTPEQQKNGETPMGIAAALDDYIRYHTSHDRAYQRASKELLDRRKQRLKAEIGFERQEREKAEEIRKAEKHRVAMAIANLKKQRLEMKFGQELADALPPISIYLRFPRRSSAPHLLSIRRKPRHRTLSEARGAMSAASDPADCFTDLVSAPVL